MSPTTRPPEATRLETTPTHRYGDLVPDAAAPIAAESVLGGRYRLVRLIAGGGMAEVWEAHDEMLARAVAVKVLHPHLADDPEFLERFRREAVAAARLSHPNVVAIFDTGVDGGVAYIVMELVRGSDAAGAARRPGRARPGAGGADRRTGRRSARLRARPGHRPPRRQARATS